MSLRVYNSGFDSYDPDGYDPSVSRKVNNADNSSGPAYTTAAAKPGQKMQINITINNATALELTAELFQWLNSFSKVYNATYVPTLDPLAYTMVPHLTFEGIARQIAGTGGIVTFNQNGDLVVRGDDSGMVDDPVLTIGCTEIGYRSLLDASAILPFVVTFIRETVTTSGQIDKTIEWFKKTIGGASKNNRVSPRAYFRPNQFQDSTIDIPVEFPVDIDSGIRLAVKANEVVTMSLFISFWTYQNVV